jgi:hypothetical protein
VKVITYIFKSEFKKLMVKTQHFFMIYSFKMFHQEQKGTNIPCMYGFIQCELCTGHYRRGKSAEAISELPKHLQCQCIVDNPTGTIMCNGCGTPKVKDGIRRGYHPDNHSPCIPEQFFRNERETFDGLSMVCQKKIQTRDIGTQCNVCCGSFEQEETRPDSSVTLFDDCVSSSDNPNSLTEISFCTICDRVDGLNGKPVGEHSETPGNCGSDRMSVYDSNIVWCNGCNTPFNIGGKSLGHHTENYRCVPEIQFLTSNYFQYSGCYSLDQFIVLPSRSLPNDEIPCRECGEVMVPNPEQSDAVDRGYCENCWRRR